MINIASILQRSVAEAVKTLFDLDITPESVVCTPTRKEFTGDYTVVVFPYSKIVRQSPLQTGEAIGQFLVGNVETISGFNVIQGFLNLEIVDTFWTDFLGSIHANAGYGFLPANGRRVMMEYSSPNTNKPLHLGHVRNILIGCSVSNIMEAAGYEVVRTQVINDRGVAICKSMLAWQLFGGGKTPESENIKPDHFVGDYYVMFEKKIGEEYKKWQLADEAKQCFEERKKQTLNEIEFFKEYKNDYFNKHSELGAQVKKMLLEWENNHPPVRELWKQMNGWVYAGFGSTYDRLGAKFDKNYYESETYELGRDLILDGLAKNVFYQKEDTSVWIDLEAEKLDQKLVLRSDGTSVYMTQDIGMSMLRYQEFAAEKVVYVVADEQDYHFKVLFEILKKMDAPYASGLFHLSYGLVELPTGRMKTREGTVVDADDLMDEVVELVAKGTDERATLQELPKEQIAEINRRIGLGALKYQLIKVNPKKKMVFDPEESVKLEGNTAPYIQYPCVRIKGLLRDAAEKGIDLSQPAHYEKIESQERDLLLLLYKFENIVRDAAENYDPSLIANYCYDLAVSYNKFWHDVSIFKAADEAKIFRLQLSRAVGNTLENALNMLGIEVPEKM
ncbi:MAG: hypothetical protein RL757_61 [Bacteroidota bacterium]